MYDMKQQNTRSMNVNEDMKLLKEFSHPSIDHRATGPMQVSELGQLLKSRNAKFKYSQQAKFNTHEWVRRKGGDLKPLVDRITNMKQFQQKQKMRIKTQTDCYFYISDVSYSNQKQYIKKNFEYGIFCTMQRAMTSQNQRYQGNFAQRMLEDRKQKHFQMKKNNQRVDIPIMNVHPRNKNKKQAYIQATKRYISSHENLLEEGSVKWIEIYRSCVREQFWDILKGQISVLTRQDQAHQNQEKNFIKMAIASLRMLEAQYSSSLPSNYENILHYLNSKYLQKMNGEYSKQGVLGATWGVTFLLYQAGRRQECYAYIRDDNLKNALKEADRQIQSYESYNPKQINIIEQNSDAFYNQLVYALKGIPKYASDALCDIQSHDVAWVFLRNVAIFGQRRKFEQLRQELVKNYQGPFISETKMKNLLYLLSYAEIAEIGTNDIMDQDDYLHFLLAIYYTPSLRHFIGDKKVIIEKKLVEQILNYLHELLLEKDEDYIFYMILIPIESFPNQISSVIVSSQLMESINWNFFKKKLQKAVFEDLVNQTLQKHVIFHQEYLSAAKKQCDLLGQNSDAVQFLLEMNIKSILELSISKNDLQSGKNLVNQILSRNPNLLKEYEPIFKLFEENNNVCDLIMERNEDKIERFLKNCQFLLISEQINLQLRSALNKLIRKDGFECYLVYLKNIIKASQIGLTKKARIRDLQDIYSMTLNGLNFLFYNDEYSRYSESARAKELKQVLQKALYRIQ